MVQVERAARRRSERQEAILAVARRTVASEGLDALTIKGLAVELDCAVGTVYTYFPSKGALVAALQVAAIRRLASVYERVEGALEPGIAGLGAAGGAQVLARLVLFGRSVAAAEAHQPDEVHLQQRLLTAPPQFGSAELAEVTRAAFEALARPQGLLEDAAARGVVRPGDPFERVLRWISGLNGVLLLRGVGVEAGVFDLRRLCDDLTLDLLRGWGAHDAALDAAAAAVPYAAVDEAFAVEVAR